MIIDAHTHTFPDSLAPRAVAKLQGVSHTAAFSDGTSAGLKASMRRAGIDVSVVLPVATSAHQVPHINDSAIAIDAAEAAADSDRGSAAGPDRNSVTGSGKNSAPGSGGSLPRLLSLGGMHPDFEDWEAELLRLKESGVPGIKLHPPYQGAFFDDERYLRILRVCAQLGLAVVIHAGLDVGLPGVDLVSPERIRRAFEAVVRSPGCSRLTLVAAHMGGWRQWEQVRDVLPDTGVLIDTSFSLGRMVQDPASTEPPSFAMEQLTEEAFTDLVRRMGPDCVLFGTDSPWDDQAAALERFRALPLSSEEKAAILGGNAARVFGLP